MQESNPKRYFLTRAQTLDSLAHIESFLTSRAYQALLARVSLLVAREIENTCSVGCRISPILESPFSPLGTEESVVLELSMFGERVIIKVPVLPLRELLEAYSRVSYSDAIASRIDEEVELGLGALTISLLRSMNAVSSYNLRLVDVFRISDVALFEQEFLSSRLVIETLSGSAQIELMFAAPLRERLDCYSKLSDAAYKRDNRWWNESRVVYRALIVAQADTLYPVAQLDAGAALNLNTCFKRRFLLLQDSRNEERLLGFKLLSSSSSGMLRLEYCGQFLGSEGLGLRGGPSAITSFLSKAEESKGETMSSTSRTIRDTVLEAGVELGRVKITLRDLAELSPGSLVALHFSEEEKLQLTINQETVAEGYLVTKDENLYLQIASVKE